ncbi:MAG: hypothetical protein ACLFO2_02995 [Candidatus Woesearchaeota archaeon]
MRESQQRIKEFDVARGWDTPHSIKDLLLNMNEEIGEFWNVIKWVDAETQQRLIREHKGEVEDFVGDMLFITLKVAHLCDVDAKKAITDVLDEYDERFPVEKVKGKSANRLAGGVDGKYD